MKPFGCMPNASTCPNFITGLTCTDYKLTMLLAWSIRWELIRSDSPLLRLVSVIEFNANESSNLSFQCFITCDWRHNRDTLYCIQSQIMSLPYVTTPDGRHRHFVFNPSMLRLVPLEWIQHYIGASVCHTNVWSHKGRKGPQSVGVSCNYTLLNVVDRERDVVLVLVYHHTRVTHQDTWPQPPY